MGLSYINEMAFFLAVDATPKYVRRRLDEILVAFLNDQIEGHGCVWHSVAEARNTNHSRGSRLAL